MQRWALIVGVALLGTFAIATVARWLGGSGEVAEALAGLSSLGLLLAVAGAWRARSTRVRLTLVIAGSLLVAGFLAYAAIRSGADFASDPATTSALGVVGAVGLLLLVGASVRRWARS